MKLVTLATFDLAYKADLAKAALEEAGIVAEVNDREIVAMDWLLSNAIGGVKLQVAEEDAVRALPIVEPFTRPGALESPVSDEELEKQALAAPSEEELAAAAEPDPTDQASDADPTDGRIDRERQSTRALWWMVGGLLCLPAWIVGMYYLLSAAFSSGPLSPNGRINLRVAGVLAVITTAVRVLAMTRIWHHIAP